MVKFDFGDIVEIVTPKTSYKGILLESPENGILLLKFDNGYNIGFNKKDILGIKLIKKLQQKEKKEELKKDSSKPNIGLIITGGTISSKLDYQRGGVSPLTSLEDFFKFYPDVFDKVNILRFEVPFMKDAGEMDPQDWQKIAKLTEKFLNVENISGIIITHGTDSLHYTSSALSFFLKNLTKPVVLTYSQRSSDRASSDANLNLKCACLAAISDIAEVIIVGHANSEDDFCYALRGTKVRKMHSSKRDAFKPINSEPIAKIYQDKIEILADYNPRKKGKARAEVNYENKVALIKFHPGLDSGILDYYLKNKYKGIIIEVLGLGQIAGKSSRYNWIKKLKEIQEKGVVVFAVAQTIFGRVNPLIYSTGRDILKTGVIYLEDMLAETALVKLGWVLGHKEWSDSKEKIKEKMLENFSGEFNKRLEE
jgi:glutamyl-tRNA(Gln) amidotransferase subunit D